jgi:hypothetical protein
VGAVVSLAVLVKDKGIRGAALPLQAWGLFMVSVFGLFIDLKFSFFIDWGEIARAFWGILVIITALVGIVVTILKLFKKPSA